MANVTDLGKYRLNLIEIAKEEMKKSAADQEADQRLFMVSIYTRLTAVITDMLQKPEYTADYATALEAFTETYMKLKEHVKFN